jgi:hypothetical protein
MDKLKIFVLGAARSGTSVTGTCLKSVFRLQGRGESHVMPAFQAMLDAFDDYKVSKRGKGNYAFTDLDPAKVHRHLHDFVRAFYADLYPHPRRGWIDKTPGPGAIAGIPLIRAIFPDARIVITRRGGLETVDSHAKKFKKGIPAASRVWARSMERILAAEQTAPDVLIVDQYEIGNSPDEVAARMAAYLGQPDKAAAIAEFFRTKEPQKSTETNRARRPLLADMSWSDADKEAFAAAAGETMARAGYPM